MNKSSRLYFLGTCFFIFHIFAPAHAALISGWGGQVVYDTDLDITWLADANAGAGSAFESSAGSGLMTWANAKAWASTLVVGGFTNWRLPVSPAVDPTCADQSGVQGSAGYNCTGGEFGHLYYDELGATVSGLWTTADPDKLALFSNVQGNFYWTGSTGLLTSPEVTWKFSMNNGTKSFTITNDSFVNYAWAVHDGNIAGVVVPIPAAVWLFGSGLLGLIGISRRKKAA